MHSIYEKTIQKPLISVIVPCYNGALFIEKTICAVINQSYKNFECVVIDDGSSDNTSQIIKEITRKDSRVLYHYQENKGLSGARNAGMRLSKGNYILFIDADDLIPVDAIKNLTSLISERIDIIYGKTATTDGQNQIVTSYLEHNLQTNKIFENRNKSLFTKVTEHTITGVAHNRLFAKSFLDQNALIFKEGILHEDELWFFETLFCANEIILCDSVTYYYNINNNDSIMSSYTLKHLRHYLSIIRVFYNDYYITLDNDEARMAIASYMTRIKIVIVTYWLYQFDEKDQRLACKMVFDTFRETITKHDFKNLSRSKKKLFTIFNKMIVKNIKDAQYYFKYHKSKKINKRIQAYLLAKKY